MAWLLVQLKGRLLGNALRSSMAAQASFILSTLFAVAVAVGGLLCPGHVPRPERVGGSDHGHLHRIRARLADPADPGLRPGRHPGPGHAGDLPAAHPPARGRAAGRLGYRRLAASQPDRHARGDGRAGQRRARTARRAGRGDAAAAVLHNPGPAGDHQHGRPAALPPRQGPRGLPGHPDLRPDRVAGPGDTQGGGRGRHHRGELRRRRRVAALAAARAWPRTRSRTPRTAAPAPRWRCWRCWPPSSWCSAGYGYAR